MHDLELRGMVAGVSITICSAALVIMQAIAGTPDSLTAVLGVTMMFAGAIESIAGIWTETVFERFDILDKHSNEKDLLDKQ